MVNILVFWRSAQHDFRPAIHGAFQQATQSWAPSVFGAFAKNAGLDIPRGQVPTGPVVEQTYAKRIEERQVSMLDDAAGMASGLAHLEPASGVRGNRVALDVGASGVPLVDQYLRQPDIGERIGDYAAGLASAPKMRNHALDGYENELRSLLAQRFQTMPYDQPAPLLAAMGQPSAPMQDVLPQVAMQLPVMPQPQSFMQQPPPAQPLLQPSPVAAVPEVPVPVMPQWQPVPAASPGQGGTPGEEIFTICL